MSIGKQSLQIHRADARQVYLLDQYTNPDCLDDLRQNWVVTNATRVRPRVDLRRLSRAMDKLSARHDCLRLRLQNIRGKWMAVIDPNARTEIREIDLGDLDDESFQSQIKAIANAPMQLVDSPLAEMIVVHCGERGDVIVTRVHHAITDGYGMVVLTEDLLKYLIGLPILSRAVSHAEFVQHYENPLPSRARKIEAFWKDMVRSFPKAPNIGRKAKGLEPLWRVVGKVEPAKLQIKITPESAARQVAIAEQMNIGVPTLFCTGFLEALCQCYDQDRLIFVSPISRTNPALATYMGDCTLDVIFPYQAAGKGGVKAGALELHKTMMLAIDHLPSDAARRGSAWEDQMISAGCYPNQFCAYQPRAVARQNQSLFSKGFSREIGVEERVGPYWISTVDVSMHHRSLAELQFNIGPDNGAGGFILYYDSIAYTAQEIAQLADKICDLLDLETTGTSAS
ncbi:condensation domain-containing protein [Nioella aestuarii]|uniref:condensation domain-containing protein n=1 Tax=Nioella aestuarii TaxID=1662864 RepID=UPI003D7F2395